MKLGKEAMDALKAQISGALLPGDELVIAGAAGAKGTSLIAEKKYDYLRSYFSVGFLADACALYRNYSAGDGPGNSIPWHMAEKAGAHAILGAGEGGVLSALWKLCEAGQAGLQADLRKIPIRQETIEICEIFGANPYYLLSEGTILIGIPSGAALVQEYLRMGLPAAIVGQSNHENARLLYSGQNVRYLDRPGEDEIKGVLKTWRN